MSVFKSRQKHSYFVAPLTNTHNRLPPAPLVLRPYGASQIFLLSFFFRTTLHSVHTDTHAPQLTDPLEIVDVADLFVNHVGDHIASVHFDHYQRRQNLATDLRQRTANQLPQIIQLQSINQTNLVCHA